MTITALLKKPQEEYEFFLLMPRDMRVLLVTNMIYAFVLLRAIYLFHYVYHQKFCFKIFIDRHRSGSVGFHPAGQAHIVRESYKLHKS